MTTIPSPTHVQSVAEIIDEDWRPNSITEIGETPMRNTRFRATVITVAIAVAAGFGLTACGKTERWCERDQGDVLVENWHCEQNLAGYEWEPDHDKPKTKKKPIKSKKQNR
ncbi:hypothetical protein OG563_18285 [Nocardia vinacea]|uniref:Lipoprotein n=1 Tax=Nocardia vinacea TaxID=96468 RepID=A0ABZ1Z3U3_9NOCA|nr:hypothetical protein [Nocardia vinacea]